MKREIELIPVADGNFDFTHEVDLELENNGIVTHDNINIVYVYWNTTELPEFKKYLIDMYGEEITKYDKFCIQGT